jgi:hypothetical protein
MCDDFGIFFDLLLVSLMHLCFLSYISILQAKDQAMVDLNEDLQICSYVYVREFGILFQFF